MYCNGKGVKRAWQSSLAVLVVRPRVARVLREVHGCNGNAELEVEGQEVLPEGGRQLRGKERQRGLSEGKRQLLGKRRSVMLPGRIQKLRL